MPRKEAAAASERTAELKSIRQEIREIRLLVSGLIEQMDDDDAERAARSGGAA
jgi:hypothetical protein